MLRRAGLLAVLVGMAVATGCASQNGTSSSPDSTGRPASQALAQLATLAVKPLGPMDGYSRGAFGPAWMDVDNDNCDTRDEILRRDLTDVTLGRDGCQVTSGVLHDPYTGKVINFVRGIRTSTAVQIDHVVALGDAWRTGARALTRAKRERLANDPIELIAVDGPANESKGDKDASQWLPPDRDFACTYASKQIAVKVAYGLWVTQAEHDALAHILSSCGTTSGTVPSGVPAKTSAPATPTPATPAPATPTPGNSEGGGVGLPVVHAGAYCEPEGALGVTSTGKAMKCTSKDGDRPRWRSVD